MVPWAYPSPQSKRHLDRFSRFGRPFLQPFALCYQTVVCLSVCPVLSYLSVCDVGVLWPNGWTDQDETWLAGRPWLWQHCVRWGPSSPSPKGAQPPNCQPITVMAKWLEVGLTPSDVVLDGDPATPSKKGHSPNFRPMSIAVKRLYQDTTWYGGKPQSRRHCVRWGPSFPRKKHSPHPVFWPMSMANGWMDQDTNKYGVKSRPRRRCVRWGRSPSP